MAEFGTNELLVEAEEDWVSEPPEILHTSSMTLFFNFLRAKFKENVTS